MFVFEEIVDKIDDHFFGVMEIKGHLVFFEVECEKAFFPGHPFVFEEVCYGFYEVAVVHVCAPVYSVFVEFVDCGMDRNASYEVYAGFLF